VPQVRWYGLDRRLLNLTHASSSCVKAKSLSIKRVRSRSSPQTGAGSPHPVSDWSSLPELVTLAEQDSIAKPRVDKETCHVVTRRDRLID
jgi:hypothetical protein